MAAKVTANDRKLAELYAGLRPVERARLMARVYRAEDLPQIALLRSSTPPRYRSEYREAGRILCRLRFPLLPMAESLLHRVERDLARLLYTMLVALHHNLDPLYPASPGAPSQDEVRRGNAGGADFLSTDRRFELLAHLTAASYARARAEHAAITQVDGELRRDVLGGENPLPVEVEALMEQAAATLAVVPQAWALVEGAAASAGIRDMPALAEPDAAANAKQAQLVRELLTHGGWM